MQSRSLSGRSSCGTEERKEQEELEEVLCVATECEADVAVQKSDTSSISGIGTEQVFNPLLQLYCPSPWNVSIQDPGRSGEIKSGEICSWMNEVSCLSVL